MKNKIDISFNIMIQMLQNCNALIVSNSAPVYVWPASQNIEHNLFS